MNVTMKPVDIALALLVVLVWGVNFVVIKVGVAEVPPLLLGALRFLAAALPAVGRSRICPTLDLTIKSGPRYLLMVFALAGDSTMTSDLPIDSFTAHPVW